MNAPLVNAGALTLLAAGVHGVAGEMLVVRKLSPDALPPSPFGGGRATLAMIHVTWHMTTLAFLTVGIALLLAGTVVDGDGAHALAVLGAAASTGFAALAVGLGVARLSPRSLLRHPAPILFTVTAVLAWLGAL